MLRRRKSSSFRRLLRGFEPLEPRRLLADFGDAPSSYDVDFGAASHTTTGPRLGALRDDEPAAAADATAHGDDRAGDDEDGVTIRLLVAGTAGTATVMASEPARLDAWVDFDRDGHFDAGERITPGTGQTLTTGGNSVAISVPADAAVGTTYARFRISSAGGLQPGGAAADGEVEDHLVSILPAGAEPGNIDLGDAPATYLTTVVDGGAMHRATGLLLGMLRDTETEARAPLDGTSDDATVDDEDGIAVGDLVPGGSFAIDVTSFGGNGRLDAWIDWNRNGTFDDADRITPAGGQAITLGTQSFTIQAPAMASPGATFGRFRLSSSGGLAPFGLALDGEVEDLPLTIGARPVTVYVDDNWPDPRVGRDPDGAGGIDAIFGRDAFARLSDALAVVATGGTIELLAGTHAANAVVDRDVTLQGADAATTILDGGRLTAPLGRVLDIRAGASVTVSHVTIRNGQADDGGGVRNAGTLTIDQAVIADNVAGETGGGVASLSGGVLRITDSVVRDNVAGTHGGGVHTLGDASFFRATLQRNRASAGGGLFASNVPGVAARVELTESTVAANEATGTESTDGGGGVYRAQEAELDVESSAVIRNVSFAHGGGLFVASPSLGEVGRATLSNATVSGNRALQSGGGLYDDALAELRLSFVTVAGNRAERGGGLFDNLGTLTLGSTLIAANDAPNGPEIIGQVISLGHNLIGNADGADGFEIDLGDLLGTTDSPLNPRLGPLADNGGRTVTHALLPGSSAIDRGDRIGAPLVDQRGRTRPRDGDGSATAEPDVGAYEFDDAAPPPELLDFGDAPATYGTLLGHDGARHTLSGLALGSLGSLDADTDGRPSAEATGDDTAGSDDEDETNVFSVLAPGERAAVTVIVIGQAGRLDAFVDFDRDGHFDENERITPASGAEVGVGANAVLFDVPADALVGRTFARLRLSTAGGLGPIGAAPDGEVEDVAVSIAPASYTFAKLAQEGAAAAGAVLTEFGDAPALDDSGTVAFVARPAPAERAILLATPTSVTPAVDTSGAFVDLRDPVLSAGRLAFFADLDANAAGLFVRSGGTTTTIADTSGPLEGFAGLALNDAGRVAFVGRRDDGGEVVATGTGGATTTIAEAPVGVGSFQADTALNAAGTVAFAGATSGIFRGTNAGTTTVASTSGDFATVSAPTINLGGTVAFRGLLDTGAAGVFRAAPGGAPVTIADSTGAFAEFGPPSLNDAGRVLFRAVMDDGRIGLFTGPDPIADRVVRTGDVLDGGVVTGLDVGRFGFNERGQVAFVARLHDGRRVLMRAAPRTSIDAVDDAAQVDGGSQLNVIQVLDNDLGGSVAAPLVVIAVGSPAHGRVVVDGDGAFVSYTPDDGYTGPDAFTYVASNGLQTDTATVSVTVGPPPDIRIDRFTAATGDATRLSLTYEVLGSNVRAFSFGFFTSADLRLDGGDTERGPRLPVAESSDLTLGSHTITFDRSPYAAVLAGSEPLLVQADVGREVAERNELNNVLPFLGRHPWHNLLLPADTTGDGQVTPIDALVGITRLNTVGSGPLPVPPTPAFQPAPFFDTNPDDQLTPLDVLQVINALNQDQTPPDLSAGLLADTPEGGSTSDGITADPRILGVVTDARTGVDTLRASIDGGAAVDVVFSRLGDFLFVPPALANGPHTIRFTATDARGRSSTRDVSFTLVAAEGEASLLGGVLASPEA